MKIKKYLKALVYAAAAGVLLYLLWIPYVPRLKYSNPKTTAIMERRLSQAKRKGKKLAQKMFWKNISEISPNLVHAVVLAEDDTFYGHKGFDFEQIKIAVKINWKKKKFAYGGSTITQQLARTLYLSTSKNILRKLKEAEITIWMEHSLSKRRILELYLNAAEWGDGIYGAEAAALRYYGKSCLRLTPEESVALASILPSPRKWSPLKETKFMDYRRSNILSRMTASGYISGVDKEKELPEISDETSDEDDDETSTRILQ